MVKNIVFDIGNIILNGSSSSALNKIELDDESKRIIKEALFDSSNYMDLDYGRLDFRGYYDKYSELLPVELKEIGYYALVNSYILRGFNDSIKNLIIKLCGKGYKIYVLSNNNEDVYNYIKKSDLDRYINGYVISCFYGVVKPEKDIYKILFDKYELKPSECYFIDDKKDNIDVGEELGMKGFILDWEKNKFEDLLNDLRNNGVVI